MARSLSKGHTGRDVSELQAALNFHMRNPAVPLKPDGIFGPLTDARLRDFQACAGVKVDGIAGPVTTAALYRSLGAVLEVDVAPRKSLRPLSFVSAPVAQAPRLALFGAAPGLRQFGPTIPDRVSPTTPAPQTRSAVSGGVEVKSRLVFDPLSKGKDGEHRFRLTISHDLPWPVFLPKPLKLDVEASTPGVGKHELDAKIKVPFDLKLPVPGRFQLQPYFFLGGRGEPEQLQGPQRGRRRACHGQADRGSLPERLASQSLGRRGSQGRL